MSKTLQEGVAGVSTGTGLPIPDTLHHTVVVDFTNAGGSVTSLVAVLEGSLDNTIWFPLETITFTSQERTDKIAVRHTSNKLVDHIRSRVATLADTGTSSINIKCLGRF